MTELDAALQETGCAAYWDKQVVVTVEKLPNGLYLLMGRRGVSIFLCSIVDWIYLSTHYPNQKWESARINVVRSF